MKRICLGTMITLLYQSRRSADKIKLYAEGFCGRGGYQTTNKGTAEPFKEWA